MKVLACGPCCLWSNITGEVVLIRVLERMNGDLLLKVGTLELAYSKTNSFDCIENHEFKICEIIKLFLKTVTTNIKFKDKELLCLSPRPII